MYLSASACSSSTQVGQPCMAVILAVSSAVAQNMWVQTMSSAGSISLQESQIYASPNNATGSSTTYQISLPASLLSVTVTVVTSGSVAIYYSYQYVTPTSMLNDWQSVDGGSSPMAPSNSSHAAATINQPEHADGSPAQHVLLHSTD